ncbi:MAG TPA: CATRA conflict system CASPASE/TPR repeat-associated protein [Trebonia sp.]|jgi:predicted nucleotide-binding protein|nr:CATRA conflict system CASPASE/TPR repeat-associated protein [Trebonia sp.]
MDPLRDADRADVDQQLIVHLFAPGEGPRAAASYAALRDLWLACRQLFLMREPIAGIGLPDQLPATYRELAGSARYRADEEAALAAQERPDADCQAILRRHRNVLNLSVVLAAPEAATPPASGHSWWQDLDSQWSFLAERSSAALLGEARIYLARSPRPADERLDALLPAAARISYWGRDRAATDGPLAIWEALPWSDDRAVRRLVLAFGDAEEADLLASVWAWSRGDTAIPPLARYLLQAAKLRSWYRGWRREAESRAPDATVTLDSPGVGSPEARQRAARLRSLRRGAEIAEHNMRLVVSSDRLLAPEGPFADDRNLAQWFQAQLDDDLAYLAIAEDRASAVTGPPNGPMRARPTRSRTALDHSAMTDADGTLGEDDISRNVFVVHGRDAQAADALFGFLASLGLRPLGWEDLVAACRTASPYLRDVIMQGIAMAQAAVVLMTPDDMVWLHRDLHAADEDAHEMLPAMQARPNVILELGMVLATYAERTVVLVAGKHRPMADLSGLNFIRLTDKDECLDKIRLRLQTARCAVSPVDANGAARAWFSDLVAYDRRPRFMD